MSKIKRKRGLRRVVFYACASVVLALVFMYRLSIFAALISFLNMLAETYDSLAGR
jgi:uncharacterized membrane protein